MYTYEYMYIHICMCTCMHIHKYVCMRVCVYIYMYTSEQLLWCLPEPWKVERCRQKQKLWSLGLIGRTICPAQEGLNSLTTQEADRWNAPSPGLHCPESRAFLNPRFSGGRRRVTEVCSRSWQSLLHTVVPVQWVSLLHGSGQRSFPTSNVSKRYSAIPYPIRKKTYASGL